MFVNQIILLLCIFEEMVFEVVSQGVEHERDKKSHPLHKSQAWKERERTEQFFTISVVALYVHLLTFLKYILRKCSIPQESFVL